jgi:hypothetical protein
VIAASTRILEASARNRSFSRHAVRIRDLLDRANPGRQVQNGIDVAHGVGDRRRVEEVEGRATPHTRRAGHRPCD